MTSLRLQPRGYGNQNLILEKLHHEAIEIQSIAANYIPRTLIGKDPVLGEDRLSQFKEAYPIDLYLETVEGFEGQNAFASKFGMQIQSAASVMVSRRGWDMLVGQFGKTVLPNRPAEGDLIYIPMTKGLFEISFVNHQAPFYQLGQFYTYKMSIELFRFASETIATGVSEIDKVGTTHSTDVTVRTDPNTLERGADNSKFTSRASSLIFDTGNPFGEI